jgi:DNA mismatch endonuclease (patch repair protein)
MDVHTREQRSRNMAAIRGKDTSPEKAVRSLVHRMGHRYRLHVKELPGKPDLVFPSLRKVIFVHGCFWHRHRCRLGRVRCASNADFWEAKLTGNVQRDRRAIRALRSLGWDVLVVWECWTRDRQMLAGRLSRFLEDRRAQLARAPAEATA